MVPKEDWRLPGKGIGTFLLKSLSYRRAVSNVTSKKCEYYCVLIFAHLLPCDVSVLFLQISLTLQSPKLPCHKWFVYKPQNIYCTKGCWWWQTECICAAASIWHQLLKVHPNIFFSRFLWAIRYCVSWFFSPVCKAKEIFHCVALTKWSLHLDFTKTAWGCVISLQSDFHCSAGIMVCPGLAWPLLCLPGSCWCAVELSLWFCKEGHYRQYSILW